MLMAPATILSAASSRVIQYQGGENGEVVTVYNPSTNSNSVFLALNRDATTAAVTGQVVVAPGQWSPPFILTEKDNRGGINGIAATGDTVVSVLRQSFRNGEELNAVLGGIFGGMLAAQYWVAISGTQIQLAGAFTEARADTIRNKTTGTALAVTTQAAADGIIVGQGAAVASQVIVRGAATGPAIVSAAAATSLEKSAGISAVNITASETQFRSMSGQPLVCYDGAGSDPRVEISSARLSLNTPVAGGAINSVFKTKKVPIKSGVAIANGDIVIWDPNNGNRVDKQGATTDVNVLGQCLVGGTGNAGGTVFAEVIIDGTVIGSLLGNGACVAGQFLILGSATVGRVDTATTRTNASFGRGLKTTAVDGTVMDYELTGCT